MVEGIKCLTLTPSPPLIHPSPSPSPSPSIMFKSCKRYCKPIQVIRPQRRLVAVVVSVAFNPDGNYDLSLLDDDNFEVEADGTLAPLPPKQGRFEVVIHTDAIRRLDLYPFQSATSISSPSSAEPKPYLERTIGFQINYTRDDPYDKREVSEYPDVRLWFVRLDATYPWLPVLLDWRAGELARYAAMLVPHQMSMRMGVVFNPEALELFVMNKVFIVYSWLRQHGVPQPKARLKTSDMARILGFGIGDDLFNLIDDDPVDAAQLSSSTAL